MAYLFSTPAENVQPYIYWSQVNIDPGFDINIFLPYIFPAPLDAPITQGPFTLSPTQVSDPVHVPYKITVAGTSDIWKFDNTPIRAICDDFVQFLTLLEGRGLLPGSLDLVRLALAQYLPLTFTESLFYRYGFHPTDGYVDLQPGMRVRLDYQLHQMIEPAQNYLNGFVGSGTSYLDVVSAASAGSLVTAFNPFLATMQNTAVEPNQGGAGGPIDLSGWGFAYPHIRLFYPKKFTSSDSIGSVGVANNIAILGAKDLNDLTTATNNYITNGNFSGAPGAYTFFRGRVTVTPEIQVYFLGNPTWVPLGTTFRQMISRSTVLPQAVDFRYSASSLALSRWMTLLWRWDVPGDPWAIPGTGGGTFQFWSRYNNKAGYAVYSSTVDSLDVPLHSGDYINMNISAG